ncbi:MAG: hypothetical protein Q8S19_02835 [Bacillota bacterium]|nr:hypothetical protein [Bacillota bacterium]
MRRYIALFLITILLVFVVIGPNSSERSGPLVFTMGSADEDSIPEMMIMSEPKRLLRAVISNFEEDEFSLAKLVSVSEDEFEYLLSLQDDNGIIAQTPSKDHSIPYFSNMAALAMLSNPRGYEPVKRYMEWYISHINKPDKYNVHGTMYDYKKHAGSWSATHEYDSADSYAATFLTLVLNYTQTTGDISFITEHIQPFVEIAEVLIKLQDKDGLIWAKPRYYVKFLMDNAENYRGLRDAEVLMTYLGRDDLAKRYGNSASLVAQGMETRMWLEDQQVYAWAVYGRWWPRVPQKKWYPDTVGQIYPVVFGVVDPQSDRASHLYAYLNLHYPEWTKGRIDDSFPWTVLAMMATIMRDDARAVEYLTNVYDSTVSQGSRGYPWHSFESAFFVKAWTVLGTRHVAPVLAAVEAEAAIDAKTSVPSSEEEMQVGVLSRQTGEGTKTINTNDKPK